MRFSSGQQFRDAKSKSVCVFGMSGVGKTTIARVLLDSSWFQYSVDYRIGTRYMDEHIVDNFKREAMQNKFLRDLLLSDSIYIRSNITFDNLAPLSTYLGKPGNPARGGIPFKEYKRRQAEHREAELRALGDVPEFIRRARDIYQYDHFICDSGGSLCEVVELDDPHDPAIKALTESTLLLYIEATPQHLATLVERFKKNPKPMYYRPEFLDSKWSEFKALNRISEDDAVDPDAFITWGFEQLIHHRLPRYASLAEQHGYRMSMQDIAAIRNETDFVNKIATLIDTAKK
jgi:hypothetical protein